MVCLAQIHLNMPNNTSILSCLIPLFKIVFTRNNEKLANEYCVMGLNYV